MMKNSFFCTPYLRNHTSWSSFVVHKCIVTISLSFSFIFYFGLFFALLPPNSPKNQNFKKLEKKAQRYHHFTHQCVRKIMVTWCAWFLRYAAQQMDRRMVKTTWKSLLIEKFQNFFTFQGIIQEINFNCSKIKRFLWHD